MRIARIYTGEDGRSHFEDIEVRVTVDGAMGAARTQPLPSRSVTPSEGGSGPDMDFHVAPRRQS